MLAPMARPNFTAMRTASRFSTGNTPGYPRSTRLACVLGVAPNAVDEPEKIFARVASCAWISSPMTVSHSLIAARHSPVPVRFFLILMGRVQEFRLAEHGSDDLQSHRQILDEAAGNRHRG